MGRALREWGKCGAFRDPTGEGRVLVGLTPFLPTLGHFFVWQHSHVTCRETGSKRLRNSEVVQLSLSPSLKSLQWPGSNS